jgi:hypothetical protein
VSGGKARWNWTGNQDGTGQAIKMELDRQSRWNWKGGEEEPCDPYDGQSIVADEAELDQLLLRVEQLDVA